MPDSHAETVLVSLRRLLADPDIHQWVVVDEQVKIWSVGATSDSIEIVYERPELEYVLGLRMSVRANADPDSEAARILIGNVNEPIGSFEETLQTDAEGIRWWSGEPADWWDLRTADGVDPFAGEEEPALPLFFFDGASRLYAFASAQVLARWFKSDMVEERYECFDSSARPISIRPDGRRWEVELWSSEPDEEAFRAQCTTFLARYEPDLRAKAEGPLAELVVGLASLNQYFVF